jgi:hypothetical protein
MQEMMSNKLEALAEEDEEMEEGFKKSNGEAPEDDSMDEISLEELIAELDGLEENSYSEEEGSVEPGLDNPYMEENTLAEAEDDDTVGEITVDDLKDIIRDVFADLMGGESEEGEEEGPEEEEAGEEEAPEEGEDEINLEEILAELDSLNENEDLKEEDLNEYPSGPARDRGTTNIDKNPAAIAINNLADKVAKATGKTVDAVKAKLMSLMNEEEEISELNEAMSTISTLRSELNEVNLLNAKLLYVNKLFKSKNLTEAQKVKVINAFDRAETVKETKNIFETLKESLNAPVKSAIKESLSFASKAAGVADRKPIVENNDFVARMQKLAGII